MATSDFNLKRNEVIEAAYRKIGQLRLGQTLPVNKLTQGVIALNLIVREEDARGTGQAKNLWKMATASLILQADGFVYDTSDGFMDDILELESVVYRNISGDDVPIEIISLQEYEEISDKNENGDVQKVFFDVKRDPECQLLYVWPAPSSIGTTSEVIGTDGSNYSSITGHTSAAINKPITGTSWRLYWHKYGTSGSAWVTATEYTNGELLHYKYKQMLFDFDGGSDNADAPQSWTRYFVYRLAYDLSPEYAISLDERRWLRSEYLLAREEIFSSTRPNTTSIHNKVLFY